MTKSKYLGRKIILPEIRQFVYEHRENNTEQEHFMDLKMMFCKDHVKIEGFPNN